MAGDGLDDARDYLDWFEWDRREARERRAAAGDDLPAGSAQEFDDMALDSLATRARAVLQLVDAEAGDRDDEFGILEAVAELRRRHPMPPLDDPVMSEALWRDFAAVVPPGEGPRAVP
jgi:hypothetical protein